MRYHRHLIESCAEALKAIFFEDRHADKCIEYYMRNNKKWGSRDRRFFAETVYDCVRWWRLYWKIFGKEENPRTLAIVAVSLWHRNLPLPEWDDFKSFDPDLWDKKIKNIDKVDVRESVPGWLYRFMKEDLGEFCDEVLPYLNRPNSLVIRTNTCKTSIESLQKSLKQKEIIAEKLLGTKEGLIIPKRVNIFQTEEFTKGFFEVQDGASQQVADYLDVQPGHRVIDACAGAGGKTLHIADRLQNKGKIISMDIHTWKLDQLKLRARRNGYSNIEMKPIESQKTVKRLKESADRLLLDVPCTGLGVLRRNPDTKWKITRQSIDELLTLQQDILSRYSKMLKPGGKMVYATCSLLNIENQEQVRTFLKSNPEFKLLKQRKLYPIEKGFDGFFMALLEKS